MQAKPYQLNAVQQELQTCAAIIIYGPDEGLITDTCQKIKSYLKKAGQDITEIPVAKEALKDNPGFFTDEANTISFFPGRKVIVFKEADASMGEVLQAYLHGVKTDAVLVMIAGNIAKTSSLISTGIKANNVLVFPCYEEKTEDIQRLIQQYLYERKYQFNRDIVVLLTNMLGGGRLNIYNELEKLCLYLGEKTNITVDDVKAVITDITETVYDDFCVLLANGEYKKADKLYYSMIESGENEAALVRIISGYFMRLLEGTVAYQQGVPMDSILKKLLRANQFKLKEPLTRQIMCWPVTKVAEVLEMLLKADIDTKSNTLDASLMLHKTLTDITTGAKKIMRL